MDDLAGKLSELLNSPEGMARIQNLAGMLGQQTNTAAPSETPSEHSGGNGLGALASLLGNSGNSQPALPDSGTLQLVTQLAPMLSAAQQEDENTRLLQALRPLLGEERQKKLDEAIRILQLLRMLPLLRQSGLLNL